MCEGDVLVKIAQGDGFISFRTYQRDIGSRGRFLITDGLVKEAILKRQHTPFYDSDCGNYAEFHKDGDYLKFTFIWMRQQVGCHYVAEKQLVAIPIRILETVIYNELPQRILCQVPDTPAKIDATRASQTLRWVLSNKFKRRAFSKAMRDCFQWKGDVVYLQNDGKDDFFFTTRSGFPSCGGLILHRVMKNGRFGIYYSVHT